MATATAGLLTAAKPMGIYLLKLGPQVWQAKRVFQRATGWTIADPVEPVLVLAFALCVLSWFFSFVGIMEFRGYFTTCVLGAGSLRIHLLGSLKEQLDRFSSENEHFRAANRELKNNVNQLNAQNDKLQSSNKQLETSIQSLDEVRQAMEKYAAETQGDMNEVITSLHNSIAEQRRIQQQAQEIEAHTRRLTIAQERSMLMSLFMQFQDQDGQKGLSRGELETLLDMLPDGSGSKLRNYVRDFKDLDTDGDGVISMTNFRDWVRRVGNDMGDGGFSETAMPSQGGGIFREMASIGQPLGRAHIP